MPATEQTWRDNKLLHLIFGISSLVMLLFTVWMLAADHSREWKGYQRQYRELEAWNAQARINAQQTAEFDARSAELHGELATAQATPPDEALVEQFVEAAEPLASPKLNNYNLQAVNEQHAELKESVAAKDDQSTLIAERKQLIGSIEDVIRRARLADNKAQSDLKFKRAELDQVRGDYFIAIDNSQPAGEIAALESQLKKIELEISEPETGLEPRAQRLKTHREQLEDLLGAMNADVNAAEKRLSDHGLEQQRLADVRAEQRITGLERLLELPILDAFQGPLKPQQVWLPQLTINNNFRDVARFDRCISCHQGITKTAAGSASEPGYVHREELALTLATPEQDPSLPAEGSEEPSEPTTEAVYGFTLAQRGMFDDADVTVEAVRPRTPAAMAGLQPGDVIRAVNDASVLTKDRALSNLLVSVNWGEPLTLRVDRGVPHPFASHPRLDLYLGSLSPHPIAEFGCTICHEGQGSATAFKWASHTPDNPREARKWSREHGWFNNHHWIYPMRPDRFEQSSCLKCHHDVAQLEPSERYPEPPADKLVAGYHLIREYGCYGCHEINGYKGPGMRQGPDIRAEPPYFAAAAQLLADPALSGDELDPALEQLVRLAREVEDHPEHTATRKRLAELVEADEQRAMDPDAEQPAALSRDSHLLADILGADDEQPGEYRKVGPSLRHVAAKVNLEFLYSWIREPKDFRPSTKMPQFFALYDHLVPQPKLDGQGEVARDEHGEIVMHNPGLDESQRLEPIEIRAVSEYLLESSQPFEYLPKPEEVTERQSAERGKLLFQTRGCLACHKHADFPEGKADQGPDLSRLGSKLDGPQGARWLYTWLRNPDEYHARTLMPNLMLEPIDETPVATNLGEAAAPDPQGQQQPEANADAQPNDAPAQPAEQPEPDNQQQPAEQAEQPDPVITDPAADITVYLLSHKGWEPEAVPEIDTTALDELALMYLEGAFTRAQARQYLEHGIPESIAAELVGDERVLAGEGQMSERKKLLYLGRRTISRLGCSGCHDIPGFESAKPIGTGLADWGRKQPSTLAFEQILQYLARTEDGEHHEGHLTPGEHAHLDTRNVPDDEGFFLEALQNHEREGFLWQKLREPRSYDYMKTQTKKYTDRLRMPQFPFSDEQREEVMTFVLGLVAEPPAAQYVYEPEPREQAIFEGEKLLTKYNCVGCHTMNMETWAFDYLPFDAENAGAPGMLFPPAPFDDYAFLFPHFTPEQIEASKQLDARGLGHAELHGRPNPVVAEDDNGNPLYFFELWQPTVLAGDVWPVGGTEVPISGPKITEQVPPRGGDFARLLHPVALELEQQTNPNAKESDAWGWVPPPLVREGEKVQPDWLHEFLLEPYPIRPAAILRMPKFNLSSEEASTLVDYFAAVDNEQYPYEYSPRMQPDHLRAMEQQHPGRLQDALGLVLDNNLCVKCHLVGDFRPQGAAAALAPNLAGVHERIRPEFLEHWIANPKRLLPYTGMPVNFPPNKPASQELYEGTAEEQLQAVVDLLLHYDEFMKERTSIAPLVQPAPAATEEAAQ